MTDRSATGRKSIAAVARVAATRRDSMGTTRRPSSDTRRTRDCPSDLGVLGLRQGRLAPVAPRLVLGSCVDLFIKSSQDTLTFSHDGGRVYPTPTRNHPAWRGTRRARRPRAHGSAEASPAQHHCTLRARSLTHSSLDAVQSGVANANHHCSSTANICTTTPSVHIARLHLPCKY
jgi:hypothetical protein